MELMQNMLQRFMYSILYYIYTSNILYFHLNCSNVYLDIVNVFR